MLERITANPTCMVWTEHHAPRRPSREVSGYHETRTLLRAATGTVPTGPSLRDSVAAEEGYRRLGLLAWLFLGATVVSFGVWIIEGLASSFPLRSIGLYEMALVATLALLIIVTSRRQLFGAKGFAPFALIVEVLGAAALGAPILGWQQRLGPDAVRWLTMGGPQPLTLGAGMVPWAGIWIILFATLVPLRPREHLLGVTLATLTIGFWPVASVLVLGLAEPLQSRRVEVTAHVAIWLMFRTAVAAGIAYFAARYVHGLRRRLAAAQRLGSYELKERLGEGGMGEVWTASHRMLARKAAIKLIRGNGQPSEQAQEMLHRFEREVQAAAQLQSPHTIEIYDYGLSDEGQFYYVMELLDGIDLEQLVRRHGPQPWARVVTILRQVCHSLAEAHARGLVHRDIKPANIFLCRIGRDYDQVKVLDFGLVKMPDGDGPSRAALTQKGMFIGTPAYAPPEQAEQGLDATDPRGDIYAIGGVAFWLLTGRTVFQANSPIAMLLCHARDEPVAPSRVSELEVPEALDRLVLACLAKKPAARPASADALAETLAGIGPAAWGPGDAASWWARHRPESVAGIIV